MPEPPLAILRCCPAFTARRWRLVFEGHVALKRADFCERSSARLVTLEEMLKVTTFCSDAHLQSLSDRNHCFLKELQRQWVPDLLQNSFQFSQGSWLRMKGFVLLYHNAPYAKVQWIQIRWVGGHLSFEINAGFLCQSQSWVWHELWAGAPSCWKMNSLPISAWASCNNLGASELT